jgi:endonuclease YncB( thermonuclease family)
MRWWLPLALLPIVLLLLAGPRILASRDLSAGEVTVIDGDTLQVGDTIVQLYGIDAPELGQLCYVEDTPRHCGIEAAFALRKLIALAQPSFHCTAWDDGHDSPAPSGVTVEVCEVGNEDLAQVMLHGGYSIALPGSFPDYVEAQQQAQEGGLGVWPTAFVLPWKWRAGDRLPTDQVDCNIRGIADAGPFYFVPTDSEYNDLVVDSGRGDALFCSDEEARQAGWRRPGEGSAPN